MRIGIFAKLLASALLLVLITLGIAGIISGINSRKALESLVVQEIRNNASSIIKALDKEIDLAIQLTRSWSIIDIIAEGLENNDNKLVQEFVTPVVSKMGMFSTVIVTRPDGIVFAFNETGLQDDAIPHELVKSLNLTDSPWFRHFADTPAARIFIGDLRMDRIDSLGSLPRMVNEIVVPVTDFMGERIGFFLTHYPASKLTDILDNFIVRDREGAITGFPVLVTGNGRTILPSRLERRIEEGLVRNRTGDGLLHIGRESYIYHSSRSEGYGDNPGFGWSVTFYVKESLANQPVLQLRNRLLAATAVIIPLIILAAYLFARYFTRPILALTSAMKRIEQGDYETPIEKAYIPGKGDELVRLQHDFEVMRVNICQRNKDIADIMDNVSVGLMTLDRQLRIGPSVSSQTRQLFNRSVFADVSFPDVLYPGNPEKREKIRDVVNFMFKGTASISMLSTLIPDEHVPFEIYGPGTRETRYLKLNFEPVCTSQGLIEKLMISVSDVTRQLELDAALREKTKESAENMAMVSILAEHGIDTFMNFSAKHLEALKTAEELLSPPLTLDADRMNHLKRIFHTTKGDAASFKLAGIASLAHDLEDLFLGAIESGDRLRDDQAAEIRGSLAFLRKEIGRIGQKVRGLIGLGDEGETRGESPELLLTVPERKVDNLIARVQDREGGAIHPNEILEGLRDLKKIKCRKLFNRFPDMVERMAGKLGKKIRFEAEGLDLRIDAKLLDRIGDPLVHLVRNSADHGIEMPEERRASGKSEEGVIHLGAAEEEGRLVITLKDDGGGIRLDKLKAKVLAKGLTDGDRWNTLSDGDKYAFIFHSGLSTKESEEVSELSGRGVGMDVVKATLDALGGVVQITSASGAGTEFRLIIPVGRATA